MPELHEPPRDGAPVSAVVRAVSVTIIFWFATAATVAFFIAGALGATLAVALLSRGFHVDARPGEGLRFVRDAIDIAPLEKVARARAGAVGPGEWDAMLDRVGIGEIDLGEPTNRSADVPPREPAPAVVTIAPTTTPRPPARHERGPTPAPSTAPSAAPRVAVVTIACACGQKTSVKRTAAIGLRCPRCNEPLDVPPA